MAAFSIAMRLVEQGCVVEISNVISRFANSFDLKDWDGLASILAEQIEADYSDLRGSHETISGEQFVALRVAALDSVNTHHVLCNPEIEITGAIARCRISGTIFRRKGADYFNSHVIYMFELTKIGSSWKISYIKQTILWNEGNPGIHAGAKMSSAQ